MVFIERAIERRGRRGPDPRDGRGGVAFLASASARSSGVTRNARRDAFRLRRRAAAEIRRGGMPIAREVVTGAPARSNSSSIRRAFLFSRGQHAPPVEHPVTEMVTAGPGGRAGADRRGRHVLLRQRPRAAWLGDRGALIAEDPATNFMRRWDASSACAAAGTRVRNDSGVYRGFEVRSTTIRCSPSCGGARTASSAPPLLRALDEYCSRSTPESRVHRWLASHPEFAAGRSRPASSTITSMPACSPPPRHRWRGGAGRGAARARGAPAHRPARRQRTGERSAWKWTDRRRMVRRGDEIWVTLEGRESEVEFHTRERTAARDRGPPHRGDFHRLPDGESTRCWWTAVARSAGLAGRDLLKSRCAAHGAGRVRHPSRRCSRPRSAWTRAAERRSSRRCRAW